MSGNIGLDILFVILSHILLKIQDYLCSVAILVAILDFIPLECSEKMAPYFFLKLMIPSFKIRRDFTFNKKKTRVLYSMTNVPTLISIYLSICLSVCLPVCLSVHPSVRPSVYPSIYLSTSLSISTDACVYVCIPVFKY